MPIVELSLQIKGNNQQHKKKQTILQPFYHAMPLLSGRMHKNSLITDKSTDDNYQKRCDLQFYYFIELVRIDKLNLFH